ncbi:MAG: hypothetical protein ABIT23_07280 [Nitrosospira sp.]
MSQLFKSWKSQVDQYYADKITWDQLHAEDKKRAVNDFWDYAIPYSALLVLSAEVSQGPLIFSFPSFFAADLKADMHDVSMDSLCDNLRRAASHKQGGFWRNKNPAKAGIRALTMFAKKLALC